MGAYRRLLRVRGDSGDSGDNAVLRMYIVCGVFGFVPVASVFEKKKKKRSMKENEVRLKLRYEE